MTDDTPLQRALMRNTARLERPAAEAWAAEALERPADRLTWLDADEALALRRMFSAQHDALLRDEAAQTVAVNLTTRDEAAFDAGLRQAALTLQAASELVWLLDVPGHAVLVEADDVRSRTRRMIRQDVVALEVISRDRTIGFYADIDTFAGHTPPDYMVRCWQAARPVGGTRRTGRGQFRPSGTRVR